MPTNGLPCLDSNQIDQTFHELDKFVNGPVTNHEKANHSVAKLSVSSTAGQPKNPEGGR